MVVSLAVVSKATSYLADAAAEAALLNSARRAIWLKAWEGDISG